MHAAYADELLHDCCACSGWSARGKTKNTRVARRLSVLHEFAVKARLPSDRLYFLMRCVVVERNGTEFGFRLKWRLHRTAIEKRESGGTEHNDGPQTGCLNFDA